MIGIDKSIEFSFKDALVPKNELKAIEKKLEGEVENMRRASYLDYENNRCSINLPDDKTHLKKSRAVISEILRYNPKYLIVVGIGGSSLGTMAVQKAIFGKFYNHLDSDMKIIYLDSVDADAVTDILRIIEPALKKGENIAVNVVSESGTTLETIANFEIIVGLLRKYKKDYQKYIVVTTYKNSPLWNFGLVRGFNVLEVPKKIGGRYSVFSASGLFPLGIIGVDIERMLKGASAMKKECLNKDINKNPAMLSAATHYFHYKNNKKISNLFLFSSDLESIGKWNAQLIAESLGKEKNKIGKKVSEGITPLTSIGTNDLHSLLQLYLAGPNDKLTTFVSIKNNNSSIKLPPLGDYRYLVDGINEKSLQEIMVAILQGVRNTYRKKKLPFIDIILPNKKEYAIGKFLQFKMMEVMYLAHLMNVNPFDQPEVELYKKETKKILRRG